MRDGREEGARIVSSIEEATELVDKLANGFAGCNMEFRLFELGKEILLVEGKVKVTRVTETKRKFQVKK